MANTRKLPVPFKFRNGWRAQVTLANGKRPAKNFDKLEDAKDWIAHQLANANSEHAPELGGATEATLAQALKHYADLYTVSKGGVDSELNRINHYLVGAGLRPLRKAVDADGMISLNCADVSALPSGWQQHVDARRRLREKTYETIGTLARKRCSAITTADLRRFMATMKQEGLSDSTIQKEIALLRHLFNMAAKEWAWKGFENPTAGIKLGKSEARFVFITKEQEESLWQAISECDNPYFWPLVVCALETTMRKGSLLAMRWELTDLDGRIAQVRSKTGTVTIPLSQHVVNVLRDMPRHKSGRIFPMSSNAVDMAWDGIRIKAGVPTLQFRDTRHLGATAYARRGFSAHQLRAVLGHKTLHMAQVYVNLVQQDVLDAMDATAPEVSVIQVPPPAKASGEAILKGKRSERLVRAVKEKLAARQKHTQQQEVVAAASLDTPAANAPEAAALEEHVAQVACASRSDGGSTDSGVAIVLSDTPTAQVVDLAAWRRRA